MRALVDIVVAALGLLASLALLFALLLLVGSGGATVAWPVGIAAVALVVVAFRSRRPTTPRPFTGTLRAIGSRAFAVVLGLVAVGFVANALAMRRPTQADVARRFREHRPELESLQAMVAADRLSAVTETSFAREPLRFRDPAELGLSAARVDEYRRRMKAAGVRSIDVWSEGVAFLVASHGMANRGWRISVVSAAVPPTPLLPTIDGFAPGRATAPRRGFSALDDGWYVAIVW